MAHTLSIPAFYANRSVFITGGTGFVGKVLIEKLLRSCPDVGEIFVLVRPRKGLTVHERLKAMLNLPLFDRVREERPSAFEKLIPLSGDIAVEGLDLSSVDRRMLVERVSIIFHVAASVRFNDSLKTVILSNVRSTRDICILAEDMKNLVALTYVSTAYSQVDKAVVDEVLYPLEVDWRQVIAIGESVDAHILNILAAKYLGAFPNNYTFSKRIAEQVIKHYSEKLPCVIIRPTVVINSVEEPIPGWIDNFNGSISMSVLIMKGLLRVVYAYRYLMQDNVPVDTAVNATLVATWKRGLTSLKQESAPSVYNCACRRSNCISIKNWFHLGVQVVSEVPSNYIIWKPKIFFISNRLAFHVLSLLLHWLPALLLDGLSIIRGRTPMVLKMQKIAYIDNTALTYFAFNEWEFRNQKLLKLVYEIPLDDQPNFSFKYLLDRIDLRQFVNNRLIGIKKYLLHEDLDEKAATSKHLERFLLLQKMLTPFVTIWILYQTGVLSWIFNLLLYVLDRLIVGELRMLILAWLQKISAIIKVI